MLDNSKPRTSVKSNAKNNRSSKPKKRRLVSYEVFMKHVSRSPVGEVDASGVFSKACFIDWIQNRKKIPKDPEETYRKALVAHVSGRDERKPFDEDVESQILERLRENIPWPCFQDSESSSKRIGERGIKRSSLGYHEAKRLKNSSSHVEDKHDSNGCLPEIEYHADGELLLPDVTSSEIYSNKHALDDAKMRAIYELHKQTLVPMEEIINPVRAFCSNYNSTRKLGPKSRRSSGSGASHHSTTYSPTSDTSHSQVDLLSHDSDLCFYSGQGDDQAVNSSDSLTLVNSSYSTSTQLATPTTVSANPVKHLTGKLKIQIDEKCKRFVEYILTKYRENGTSNAHVLARCFYQMFSIPQLKDIAVTAYSYGVNIFSDDLSDKLDLSPCFMGPLYQRDFICPIRQEEFRMPYDPHKPVGTFVRNINGIVLDCDYYSNEFHEQPFVGCHSGSQVVSPFHRCLVHRFALEEFIKNKREKVYCRNIIEVHGKVKVALCEASRIKDGNIVLRFQDVTDQYKHFLDDDVIFL